MSNGRKIASRIFATLGIVVLVVVALGIGVALHVLKKGHGEQTGGGQESIFQRMSDATQVAIQPKEGFPGQDKLIILCMGIDDNWTDKDEVYTTGSRTDTLFLLTLNLNDHSATMLSIPRDTYTHIAGTKDRFFKINEAYSTGGPQRSIATVAELLGVHADHYMVLNIDATKKMVDALGGVDVDVPHAMHYDDKWGHLFIDLKPGMQHLNGDQAVGFARYRHGDAGTKPTPEDGDERRMFRQHMLLRAMIDKGKAFANVAQAPHLIDVGLSSIHTDLTRTQLFDLAAIYRGIQPDDIQTASLPGDDFRGPDGEWFYQLDMTKARAYTDWLVNGDTEAARRLVPVIVRNGTLMPGLAQRVVAQLKAFGYTDVRNGGNAPHIAVQLTADTTDADSSPAGPPHGSAVRSTLLDQGVPYTKASDDIATLIGLADPVEIRRPLKPNKLGWTPPASLVVTLGKDYAMAVKSSGVMNSVDPSSTPSTTLPQD